MKTPIKNVHILTMDEQFSKTKADYLVIEEDTIVELAPITASGEKRMVANQVIDGQNGILMPGMINTHTHVGMIPFRSLGDDVPDRLRRSLFPLEQFMTKELIGCSSDYAIAEVLLSGVTNFCDMYYFEDEIAKSCEKMSVHALFGETIIDIPTCDSPEPSGGLFYAETFTRKWRGHLLITPMLASHAPNTNSPEVLAKIIKLSRRYQVPVTMHIAEMTYEVAEFEKAYQKTPIAFLEELGYLSEPFILAYYILATGEDLVSLAATNGKVCVAHCIGANTKSAEGVAPIKQMLDQGIIIGLGADGPSSGDILDLFTQTRMVANFHKTAHQDYSLFPAKEIAYPITMGGAKTVGLAEQVDSLEMGKKADIILTETQLVNMFPIFDTYSALVYSANASNAEAVWVSGQQLVANKKLQQANLKEIKEELYQAVNTFVKEAKKRAAL